MSFCRMTIGEVITDDQVRDFKKLFTEQQLPEIRKATGFHYCQLMEEDGGRMIVTVTTWATREDCFRYYAGREYRKFVAQTQHMLLGQFVVKLFKSEDHR